MALNPLREPSWGSKLSPLGWKSPYGLQVGVPITATSINQRSFDVRVQYHLLSFHDRTIGVLPHHPQSTDGHALARYVVL